MPNADCGPLFVKFCSDFAYHGKLCLNGLADLKRQLEQEGIAFQSVDHGILSCADPERLQALGKEVTPARMDARARKWLARLAHPFTRTRRYKPRWNASTESSTATGRATRSPRELDPFVTITLRQGN